MTDKPHITNPMQAAVHEFLLTHLGANERGWPNQTGRYNKFLLVREEYEELTKALGYFRKLYTDSYDEQRFNEVETIDAICDLLYVIFNLCEELELDIQPFFDEVHRSNMTKVPAALSPNRKIQKGPEYRPPRIAELQDSVRSEQAHDIGG